MFISDTHLPQLLTPDDYTSQAVHERELDVLFRPGWHCVATFADLPKDGDYLTTELFGYPLILWRSEGKYQAFLNVCPHRFARLSGKACGNSGEHLQCQYHGWEFDIDGCTRKIPDAPSFKPMTKGALALTTFRTETVGQLIFVSLAEDGPALSESLGEGYEVAASLCDENRELAIKLDYEVPCNWKCKVENSLESYHVDMVHPATFGATPDAEQCEHELRDEWTTFSTNQPSQKPLERFLDRTTFRLAREEPDYEYKHFHFHPQQMFGKMRLFSWTETTLPLSPGRCRVLGWFFYNPGAGGLRSKILGKALAGWERKFFKQLADEDTAVLVEVQRGLEAGRQPSRGLISIREERCHRFQKYVKEALSTTSNGKHEETLSDRSNGPVCGPVGTTAATGCN